MPFFPFFLAIHTAYLLTQINHFILDCIMTTLSYYIILKTQSHHLSKYQQKAYVMIARQGLSRVCTTHVHQTKTGKKWRNLAWGKQPQIIDLNPLKSLSLLSVWQSNVSLTVGCQAAQIVAI